MEESEAVGHRQPQKKNRQETNDSYFSQKKKGEVELERARLSEALRRRNTWLDSPRILRTAERPEVGLGRRPRAAARAAA